MPKREGFETTHLVVGMKPQLLHAGWKVREECSSFGAGAGGADVGAAVHPPCGTVGVLWGTGGHLSPTGPRTIFHQKLH